MNAWTKWRNWCAYTCMYLLTLRQGWYEVYEWLVVVIEWLDCVGVSRVNASSGKVDACDAIAGALKEPADLKPAPASMTLAMNKHKVLLCHAHLVWPPHINLSFLPTNCICVVNSKCQTEPMSWEISVLVEDNRTCLHVWHAKWLKTANGALVDQLIYLVLLKKILMYAFGLLAWLMFFFSLFIYC
jgi:hypothetical protein